MSERRQNRKQVQSVMREKKKRIGRNDIIFISVFAAAAVIAVLWFSVRQGETGARAVVTVDGEEYGTYPLFEEQEIPIVIDGVTANLLLISDGTADMIQADCPDKLCVHQRAISKTNETIVCLPNKVVVSITGGEESGFDSIAK